MDEHINGYNLTRAWFDFAFENQDLISPNHTAMYLWFVELNNRLGWCPKFASPASQTMMAIGIKSYNTYKKTFDDLVNWGIIKLVTESKNQYTACIIALSNFDKAQVKALTKHLTKHMQSTGESTCKSTDSINKPKTNKPINQETPETKISYRDSVLLLPTEYQKLITEHGQDKTDWMLDKLNNSKMANGKKYKSDYRAILNWVVEAAATGFKPKAKNESTGPVKTTYTQQEVYDLWTK